MKVSAGSAMVLMDEPIAAPYHYATTWPYELHTRLCSLFAVTLTRSSLTAAVTAAACLSLPEQRSPPSPPGHRRTDLLKPVPRGNMI